MKVGELGGGVSNETRLHEPPGCGEYVDHKLLSNAPVSSGKITKLPLNEQHFTAIAGPREFRADNALTNYFK